jgi:hypothetical protein
VSERSNLAQPSKIYDESPVNKELDYIIKSDADTVKLYFAVIDSAGNISKI